VLYLLHGIGGTHSEWLGGEPNNVLSNLLAEGEAVPMIVVFPNVRAMKNDSARGNMFSAENFAAFDNFINDLRDDLMPFIKENYSISDKRQESAIAGLSMGGRESLFIAVSMPETFAFVGAFCPAPGLMEANLGFPSQLEPAELTLPEKYRHDTFILINTGNQDTVVGDNPLKYSEAFAANGIEHVFYSMDGGHSFDVWKNGLYWFTRCIFR
jgi:enterochelin esterase-like enzyme